MGRHVPQAGMCINACMCINAPQVVRHAWHPRVGQRDVGRHVPQAGMCISACMCINAPRWSTQLGIPEEDRNAWADSCPTLAGYDELGNYMTYSSPGEEGGAGDGRWRGRAVLEEGGAGDSIAGEGQCW